MMFEYFVSEEVERKLDKLIAGNIRSIDKRIYNNRIIAEKANKIVQFMPQMTKLNFKINDEIIDVVSNKYSRHFIPELTHQSIDQYSTNLCSFYSTLISLIEVKKKIRILDIGCGISHIANQLMSTVENIDKYYAIDFNSNVINLNRKLYKHKNLEFNCVDIKNYNMNGLFDYVLMFNILKFFSLEEIKLLIDNIFIQSDKVIVIIYDQEQIINKIESFSFKNGYVFSRYDDFFILSRT